MARERSKLQLNSKEYYVWDEDVEPWHMHCIDSSQKACARQCGEVDNAICDWENSYYYQRRSTLTESVRIIAAIDLQVIIHHNDYSLQLQHKHRLNQRVCLSTVIYAAWCMLCNVSLVAIDSCCFQSINQSIMFIELLFVFNYRWMYLNAKVGVKIKKT